MKFKTLTIIAASCLLAASYAYAVDGIDDADLSLADNTSTSMSGNVGSMSNNSMASAGQTSGNVNSANTGDADMSADTATGDDDY